MQDWYQQTIDALRLNGKSERTQDSYVRTVRMLVEFYGKTPDLISEEELRAYLLHRRQHDHWSPSTLKIAHAGLKFFFSRVLPRDWPTLELIKAPHEKRLPVVLSVEEVQRLLRCVRTPHNHAYLVAVYSCGLRLSEALHLEVGDIDGQRGLIHVRGGKGAKDRYVPLPERTLALLRAYWKTHRHPRLLFPALGRDMRGAHEAAKPMARNSIQGALRKAKAAAGIIKDGVTIHTLRHSYATHLLERGVNVRNIQRYLGHGCLETTMIYLHLTQAGQEDAVARINDLMGELPVLSGVEA